MSREGLVGCKGRRLCLGVGKRYEEVISLSIVLVRQIPETKIFYSGENVGT